MCVWFCVLLLCIMDNMNVVVSVNVVLCIGRRCIVNSDMYLHYVSLPAPVPHPPKISRISRISRSYVNLAVFYDYVMKLSY